MNQALQYLNLAAILLNVGFAAFVGATPADHPLPWYVVAVVAALNAVVHALPAPSGTALPSAQQAAKVPALLLAALIGLSVPLAGCTNGQPQQTAALLESGLTVAEQTALGYFKLSRCPAQAPVCSDPALVIKIAAADNAAFKAVKDVETAAAAGGTPDTTAATAALTALQDILAQPAVTAALKLSPAAAH